jgi:hypothetical protein
MVLTFAKGNSFLTDHWVCKCQNLNIAQNIIKKVMISVASKATT